MNTNLKPFSVRSYGLVITDGKILLSEEKWYGEQMLKFPGGGVEFGESPIGALKREFKEELDTEVGSYSLYHVSELFFESKFMQGIQVIPVYYKVEIARLPELSTHPAGELKLNEGQQIFHLTGVETFNPNQLTFESDRVVIQMLKETIR